MASAVPATESAWNVGVSVSRRSRAVRRASAATCASCASARKRARWSACTVWRTIATSSARSESASSRGRRKATPPKPMLRSPVVSGSTASASRPASSSPAARPGYPAASPARSSAKTGWSSAAASPVPALAVSSKRRVAGDELGRQALRRHRHELGPVPDDEKGGVGAQRRGRLVDERRADLLARRRRGERRGEVLQARPPRGLVLRELPRLPLRLVQPHALDRRRDAARELDGERLVGRVEAPLARACGRRQPQGAQHAVAAAQRHHERRFRHGILAPGRLRATRGDDLAARELDHDVVGEARQPRGQLAERRRDVAGPAQQLRGVRQQSLPQLRQPPVGDVADDAHQPHRGAGGVALGVGLRLQPAHAAVGAHDAEHELVADTLLDAAPHGAVQRGAVVGMDQLDQLLVLDGRAVVRQAVQRRDALRPADAVLADLPPPRGRARPGQHQLQAGLALPQRLVVAGPPHGRGEHVGDALGERRVVGREGALALAVHAQHAEDLVLRADRDGQAAGDAGREHQRRCVEALLRTEVVDDDRPARLDDVARQRAPAGRHRPRPDPGLRPVPAGPQHEAAAVRRALEDVREIGAELLPEHGARAVQDRVEVALHEGRLAERRESRGLARALLQPLAHLPPLGRVEDEADPRERLQREGRGADHHRHARAVAPHVLLLVGRAPAALEHLLDRPRVGVRVLRRRQAGPGQRARLELLARAAHEVQERVVRIGDPLAHAGDDRQHLACEERGERVGWRRTPGHVRREHPSRRGGMRYPLGV